MKAQVYRTYHIDKTAGHFEVDHLISLDLGGADVAANLWPESYDTAPWNAHMKDALRIDSTPWSAPGRCRSTMPSARSRKTGSRRTSGMSRRSRWGARRGANNRAYESSSSSAFASLRSGVSNPSVNHA